MSLATIIALALGLGAMVELKRIADVAERAARLAERKDELLELELERLDRVKPRDRDRDGLG